MRTTDVVIRLENVATVAHLLDDSYDVICDLMSQGWDSFADETKREAHGLLERLREMLP